LERVLAELPAQVAYMHFDRSFVGLADVSILTIKVSTYCPDELSLCSYHPLAMQHFLQDVEFAPGEAHFLSMQSCRPGLRNYYEPIMLKQPGRVLECYRLYLTRGPGRFKLMR
jgi:hypothetical protein